MQSIVIALYKKGKRMKILKKGRPQKGWSKEYRCTGVGNGDGGCGALLLVEQGDIYLTHHYDYTGGHDVYNTFTCASCGVETDIKDYLHFIPPEKKEWQKRKDGEE